MQTDISPVQEIDGVFFKREDKYIPFKNCDLNGSKIRQMDNLVLRNRDLIRRENNDTLITYCSVHSPQSLIFAKVAEKYGLKGIILMGGKVDIEKHYFLRQSAAVPGIEIRNVTGLPYNNVLYARLVELNKSIRAFVVKFGFDHPDYEANVIEPLAEQTINTPSDIDTLVIPVGSAICTKGILKGLIQNENIPKKVVCIQISGHDKSEVINSYLQRKFGLRHVEKVVDNISTKYKLRSSELFASDLSTFEYEFIVDKTFPYEKLISATLGKSSSEYFDKRYEAKAWLAFQKVKDNYPGKTLFWIIANNCKV